MRIKFVVYNYSEKLHGCLIQAETSTSERTGAVGHYHYESARKELLERLVDISTPIYKLSTPKNPAQVDVVRTDPGREGTLIWQRYCITPKGTMRRYNADESTTEWATVKDGFVALLNEIHERCIEGDVALV